MSDASPSTDKRRKHSLLLVLKKAGVFSAARAYAANGVRILCYHGVWRGADGFGGDSMFISRATFERRLKLIGSLGFDVIPLDEAVLALQRQAPMPRDAVVITIDDGWYSSFADMLPALKRERMHATIYCDTRHLESGQPVPHVMAQYLRKIHRKSELPPASAELFRQATDRRTDQAARYQAMLEFAASLGIDVSHYLDQRVFSYMTEDEAVGAVAQGFAIELHTHTHSLGQFTYPEISREITLNREVLGRILHRHPAHFRHFCYPGGRVASGVQSALARLGIASATTLDPGIAYRGADPLMLPRIVDGDHLSDLEFEAELYGVGSFLRRTRAAASRWLARLSHSAERIDRRVNA